MKKFIPYLILLLIVAVSNSCQDPSTVDANRVHHTVKVPPEDKPLISFSPNYIDFGYVKVGNTRKQTIQITNLKEDTLNIFDMKFAQTNSTYILTPEFGAFTFAPAGNPGSDTDFVVNFHPDHAGIFTDTLIVNNYKDPVLTVKAIVPCVYADDLVIDTNVSDVSLKDLRIYNVTDSPIEISKLEFDNTGENSVFTNPNHIGSGTIIPAKGSVQFLVNFAPTEAKQYQMIVTFEISSECPIKDTFKITGNGKLH